MAESVVVTPRFGNDSNGNPVADGTPITLAPIAIAPGNTTLSYGAGGNYEDAEFTVFLRLGDEPKVADGYGITVRGKECTARVQVWNLAGRGGVVVLAKATTGKG